LEFARREARHARNWVDLWNKLFGIGAKAGQLFPMDSDRAKFAKTPEHKQVFELLHRLPSPFGATQLKDASGNLRVRMPKSLHAALIDEAKTEGVSLNQLILSKVSVPLRERVSQPA
jgi:predicted HicB family RNase H-like nuclease